MLVPSIVFEVDKCQLQVPLDALLFRRLKGLIVGGVVDVEHCMMEGFPKRGVIFYCAIVVFVGCLIVDHAWKV